MRQQRADGRGAHLVGELRRDRALDHGVALLLHLADLAGEALALGAVIEVGVLDRAAAEVVVQQGDDLAGRRVLEPAA